MVSGHDYYQFPSGNKGIIRAVDEWVKDNDIKPWFLFDKDRSPSWFYIKV
jgi:stringent starvation protein B